MGHEAVPILRDAVAEERDALHELRLDTGSNKTRGAESKRCDGDLAQHHSRTRPHLQRSSRDGFVYSFSHHAGRGLLRDHRGSGFRRLGNLDDDPVLGRGDVARLGGRRPSR